MSSPTDEGRLRPGRPREGAADPNYAAFAQKIADRITFPDTWNTYLNGDPYNFWRIANAFTTIIDYLVSLGQPNAFIGDTIIKVFDEKFDAGNPSKWWYDDYGWWCVALWQAARYSELLGNHDPVDWQRRAGVCWKAMVPARQVWANGQKAFPAAAPRFDGGCWNHDFVAGIQNPCNPMAGGFCGIQNTVTNTQYLVATARLGLDVTAESAWLNDWFEVEGDDGLLAWYEPGQALIRERVSTFDHGTPAPGYVKDRRWTGDQGIVLGALLEMIRLAPDSKEREHYYDLARAVLTAVPARLLSDVILLPWTPPDTIDKSYARDYSTGVGVFVRYLLHAYKNDSVLRPFIASQYKSLIEANANAICDSVGTCPALPNGYAMDPMECLVNQLAVLNAAVVMLAK